MKTFRWSLLAVIILFVGCEGPASNLDGLEFARGAKLKALDPDSLAVLPADVLIYTDVDSIPGNDTLPHTVQLIVQFWEKQYTYLKRYEDGLFYRADLENGCLIDRPKPVADTLNVWLFVRDPTTNLATDSVPYAGVPNLTICAR